MSNYYAELNEKNIVYSVSQLSNKINNATLIEIPHFHVKLLNSGYQSGKFIKVQINTDNLSAITFKWLKFDLELGKYIEDTENTTPFQVSVAGQTISIQVGETLEFSSDEAGTFKIKTINEGVGNDSVEVVIDG
jgi:hypothetical protein